MKCIVCLFCLLTVLACSKSDNVAPANKLVGTWRLMTYCKPTSDSACTTIDIPPGKSVFVTFDNDGNFGESYKNTVPTEYGFLGCGGGEYKLEGDQVRIRALCMSSINGQLVQLVSVDNFQLVLNPFRTGRYIFAKQ